MNPGTRVRPTDMLKFFPAFGTVLEADPGRDHYAVWGEPRHDNLVLVLWDSGLIVWERPQDITTALQDGPEDQAGDQG